LVFNVLQIGTKNQLLVISYFAVLWRVQMQHLFASNNGLS